MAQEALKHIATHPNSSRGVYYCDKDFLRLCPCCSHIFGCKETECSTCPLSCDLKNKMVFNFDVSELKKAGTEIKECMCKHCWEKAIQDI